jgi:hypothetical protein
VGSGDGRAPEELVELDAAARALGFARGVDYGIAFLPASLGSERVDLDVDGSDYVVSYADKGSARELVRTGDWQAARSTFLEEVGRLAGPRGRGPYAGQRTPAEQRAAARTMDDAAAEYYRRFGRGR